jgi:tetratricopeptide (TPR) repeat protein
MILGLRIIDLKRSYTLKYSKNYAIAAVFASLLYGCVYGQDSYYKESLEQTDPYKKIELLNKSISYAPSSDSYFERGWVYIDLKRYNLALNDFKAALATQGNKNRFDIKASLSYCYYLLGRYRAGVALANEALMEQPDMLYALYYRGWSLLALKEWDAAMQDFEQVAKTNPKNPQGFLGLHFVFFHKGNFTKALEYINYALELHADNLQFLERKAITLNKLGQKKEMFAIIEQIIPSQPGNEGAWKLIGDLFLENEEYPLAVEYYSKTIEFYKTEMAKDAKFRELHKEKMHDVHISRGKAYQALCQTAQALGDFAQALEYKNDSYLAFNHIGALQSQKENYLEAIDAYQRCFALKADYPIGWENWGKAFMKIDKYYDAVSIFTKGLKIEDVTEKAKLYSYRGSCYARLKDAGKALKDFEAALGEDPELPSAYIGLGELLIEQGKLQEASEKLSYALMIESISSYESEIARLKKGIIYIKQQQYQQAIQELELALANNAQNTEILENLGVASFYLSDNCKALAYLEKAKSLTLAQRKTESLEAQTIRRKILTNTPNPCK